MPTENRSSNTELSKIVTEALVGMVSGVTGMKPPADEPLPGFIQAPIDRAVTRISGLLAKPAPQPHPEPIAWMVGTAIWWTKEEAERDAAETGLPVVPVGPMVDTAEFERLESRIKTQRESIRSHVQEVDRLRVLEIKHGLKIEERNDLLRKCLEWITSARDGVLYPIARDFEGVVGRNAEGLGQETPALIDAIDGALSDSAAPIAPLPPVVGDLLPPVGSKVLIHLAREDEWVEHTVVGYYAWENLRPDPSVHRVCVRVRDADGYLNARGLGDIRPVALECQP
ncbi:hypothetical protein QVM32_08140 [Pseudomonas asiatica]|uniref:hypothetical protein n=1 Tax=Pseudomonas asiatica TaxID=2219225 RepID=UPI001E623A2D|nr:hypothetical protein [Pseudomonas asiatica]MCE0955126.1 hypothetical protein [Pseudomonas asiatica]